ncbi:phosphate/phosphite/phosphonate ABC transporter substrate-binding protein [Neotabrizicola shimadae]|uniref:PhnD/SsuA/transferrin family substrate-binding protein n=1 Tax=Neotabrizicola shimadae TaxID=2807096 RepID=A0A8G1ECF4_9RHOB|nr:PhnD/SsuA/transferrin family substrate-binding protein [Neotabrizicola shimadae]QYZ70600.1 PhnD/SsuA/transferrin family substrate-binding protein [Neotabrizicola shimadae]
MIAALGMYDRAETAGANDRLWGLVRDGLRDRGIEAPDALTRGDLAYMPGWTSPDLLVSQTCGLPFRARLHDQVTLIGTPDYGVEGCPPGFYRSVLVARADDPRGDLIRFAGARLAYNDSLSQSGWAAPLARAATLDLRFGETLETGGHRLSMLAVAEGSADIAALDAVTWRLLQRWEPAAARVKVVGLTDPTPGLPLISRAGADAPPLFAAISAAIAALSPADRDTLCLKGLVAIPAADYLALPLPPSPAQYAQGH